jgi:hypothetical protein
VSTYRCRLVISIDVEGAGGGCGLTPKVSHEEVAFDLSANHVFGLLTSHGEVELLLQDSMVTER